MKTNVSRPQIRTHEGAVAQHINSELQLRRSVMANMLWENEFYEDGQAIANRIVETIKLVAPRIVADIAIEAREKMKLRHVPLLIVREMARLSTHRHLVAETLARVIQRPDELAEFVSIYWKEKRQPLSNQVKKGLALAFQKFDAYALAKYNQDGAVKLRDVLFLCHARPKDADERFTRKQRKESPTAPTPGGIMFQQLINGTLPTPDTWEVTLSAGTDKLEAWTRLLSEKKLGALALLRNLRNMQEAKVPEDLIRTALSEMKTERVLPFRFISAARHAPQLEPELEVAMNKCLVGAEKMAGKTILLIDVSGSMDGEISGKSDLKRVDAACALAMLLREICETVAVFTFSTEVVAVPARRGFALRDAIVNSQGHGGTDLGGAVREMLALQSDRLIVISDEQSSTAVQQPNRKAYMLNVASARNGVGYGAWMHIDGWSEAVVDYIRVLESQQAS